MDIIDYRKRYNEMKRNEREFNTSALIIGKNLLFFNLLLTLCGNIATELGDVEMVKCFLKEGYNVDMRGEYQETPLMIGTD